MPTTLTNGIQLPDKGSVDWYSSMQSNYNLIDTHLGDTDVHVTAEDKANWNSKQGSLSQAQLDAIAQVATNTSDIATLQSGKADASHTHSSSDITDIGDYATKQYVDNSISGLVDNAPAALDTLKELSTALNDDANFASTVTTALAAKANSSDLATVATSGSYTDLTDKPTINDSTITIQKNGSTVDTFTTNGSAKTINIPVPTKTSDLTNDSDFVVSSSLAAVATSGFYNDLENKPYIPDKISDLIDDSNFVDTSNPAVSSGITSAKVTNYDTHIADTDIHVTASDKTTWNTVTSKAQDSDVVHKSGNEYINDTKTFGKGTLIVDNSVGSNVHGEIKFNGSRSGYIVADSAPDGVFDNANCGISILLQDAGKPLHVGSYKIDSNGRVFADNTNKTPVLSITSGLVKTSTLVPENDTGNSAFRILSQIDYANGDTSKILDVRFIQYGNADASSAIYSNDDGKTSLGATAKRWSGIYATNYYYGSNNVEFSTKFVTTDTNQTVSGQKLFDDINTVSSSSEIGVSGGNRSYKVLDKNKKTISSLEGGTFSSGMAYSYWLVNNGTDVFNGVTLYQPSANLAQLRPYNSTLSMQLGASNRYFSDCYTSKINSLTPSSLGLPSDRSARVDISGYITNLGNGDNNSYTVPANGYIWLHLTSINSAVCFSQTSGGLTNYAQIFVRYSGDGLLYVFFPVRKDDKFVVQIYTSSTAVVQNAYFIPCQGNV